MAEVPPLEDTWSIQDEISSPVNVDPLAPDDLLSNLESLRQQKTRVESEIKLAEEALQQRKIAIWHRSIDLLAREHVRRSLEVVAVAQPLLNAETLRERILSGHRQVVEREGTPAEEDAWIADYIAAILLFRAIKKDRALRQP